MLGHMNVKFFLLLSYPNALFSFSRFFSFILYWIYFQPFLNSSFLVQSYIARLFTFLKHITSTASIYIHYVNCPRSFPWLKVVSISTLNVRTVFTYLLFSNILFKVSYILSQLLNLLFKSLSKVCVRSVLRQLKIGMWFSTVSFHFISSSYLLFGLQNDFWTWYLLIYILFMCASSHLCVLHVSLFSSALINLNVLAKIINRQDIKTCPRIEEETVLWHGE
jgi:hypothetical protein